MPDPLPSFAPPLHFSPKPFAAPATHSTRPQYTRRRPRSLPPLTALICCSGAPPAPSSAAAALPTPLASLAASLAAQPTPTARYRALIALGGTLSGAQALAPDARRPSTRVRGCTSETHVRARVVEGRAEVAGASDAKVAQGFLALIVRGVEGVAVEEVLAVDVESINLATALDVARMPSRAVGLAAILGAVQEQLREGVCAVVEGAPGRGQGLWYRDVQPEEVAVLLSGGVDSSVAMRFVQDAGFRPRPFYLKIWLEDELAHLGDCPWEEDIEYASAVCSQAGVELETVSMQREYWDRVVSYTISEARAGRTPNPDVMCNTRVKFGAFYDEVGKHFPRIVTGHYARKVICPETGLAQLRMSPDLVKDQTYFLSNLSQAQLAKADFPLGHLEKSRVREMATVYDLPNRARKDSQGICFLGKLKFDDFLGHHLGTQPGPLVEYETGVTLGEHRGFWFYTMGQRKGIGLSGGPWHVVSKSPEENIVYISRQYKQETAARKSFGFDASSWIAGSWPSALAQVGCSTRLLVKTRHGPTITDAIVTRTGTAEGRVELDSDAPAQALAPGQFAVFYSAEGFCLGSGRLTNDKDIQLAAHKVSGLLTRKRLQAHYVS